VATHAPSSVFAERAGYFEVPGAHLYTVLHQVKEPVARLPLVGPFASERHRSYIPWVLWARYLAGKGIEALRYDYRGIGESEGVFEEISFEEWIEDVRLLAGWLKARSPGLPLVLIGLGIGAALGFACFPGWFRQRVAALVATGKREPGASTQSRALGKCGPAV
jgi:pimeloyl-ACP methyl ester carboxylesterase